MKRYLLFAYDEGEANWGILDLYASFDFKDDALKCFERRKDCLGTWELFDAETHKTRELKRGKKSKPAINGILEYDLTDPHSKVEHLRAVQANETHHQLYELEKELRSVTKYGQTNLYGEFFDTVDELTWIIRNKLTEIIIDD